MLVRKTLKTGITGKTNNFTKIYKITDSDMFQIIEAFNFPYCNIFDTFYYSASSFLPVNDSLNPTIEYFKNNNKIDCFSYVWLVLRHLASLKLIIFPSNLVYRANEFLPLVIKNKYLKKFENCDKNYMKFIEYLKHKKCGIFLHLKSKDGLKTRGKRHMGLWFYFSDQQIEIFDYKVSTASIHHEVYPFPEFLKYLFNQKYYACYL